MGTAVLSLGLMRPEREADHSSLSGTEAKNEWRYACLPSNFLMAWTKDFSLRLLYVSD